MKYNTGKGRYLILKKIDRYKWHDGLNVRMKCVSIYCKNINLWSTILGKEDIWLKKKPKKNMLRGLAKGNNIIYCGGDTSCKKFHFDSWNRMQIFHFYMIFYSALIIEVSIVCIRYSKVTRPSSIALHKGEQGSGS